MRVALDTNRYVDLCKGLAETSALLEEADAIMLPFVVLGELRAGFAFGRRQAENERTLRRFLLKDGVRVLFPDDQTTHHYASVFRQPTGGHNTRPPCLRLPRTVQQPLVTRAEEVRIGFNCRRQCCWGVFRLT